MFAPLDLPEADAVRRPRGLPGSAYWQQEAHYRIEAELIRSEHRTEAREVITYVNHSSDALPFVWLQLEQASSRRPAADRSSTRGTAGAGPSREAGSLAATTVTEYPVDLSDPGAPPGGG